MCISNSIQTTYVSHAQSPLLPTTRVLPNLVMTIDPQVTNQSREGLVASGSMVIITKMSGPGFSGSIPSHSGNLARSLSPLAKSAN